MTSRTIQRFYKTAAAAPATDGVSAGYAVLLDGRPVKTPLRRVELVVPNAKLAEAVAREWDGQGEQVRPEAMPLTALAVTGLDTAGPRRDELIAGLLSYAETDLVCYRVPDPPALVERQRALWQPLLDWLAVNHDARLDVTTGILPVRQPPQAINALAGALSALDDMRLAALSASVRAAGSLVVGLALVESRLDAASAFVAAEVETDYQIEQWGEDAEAALHRATLKAELDAAERFLRLLAA